MPWTRPEEQGGHPWPLWSTTRENDYFKELKLQAALFTDRPFKLLLKAPQKDKPTLVIAVGSRDEMESHWNVANHVISTGTAGSGAGIDFNDPTLSALEKWAFIRAKIEGLAIDQEHQQAHAAAAARGRSPSTPKPPTRTMKPVPPEFGLEGEYCIAEYRCSLFTSSFPRTGILYLSANWLLFNSNPPIKLRYLDIMHLKRVNNNKGIGAQLAITVFVKDTSAVATEHQTKAYTFATLFKGEELYILVEQMWKSTMNKIQLLTDQQRSIAKSPSPRFTAESAVLSIEESRSIQQDALTSAESLFRAQEKEWLVQSFSIPRSQSILTVKVGTTLSAFSAQRGTLSGPADVSPVPGTLYLLSHMLLFISADFLGPLTAPSGLASSASQLFVIVPYREITQIKKDKNAINSEFSELSNIGVIPNTMKVLSKHTLFVFEVVSRDSVAKLIEERRSICLAESTGPLYTRVSGLNPIEDSLYLSDHRVQPLLTEKSGFSADFNDMDAKSTAEFDRYFSKYGKGNAMIFGPQLQQLIRKFPIPLRSRRFLWMRISGASLRRLSSTTNMFESLVSEAQSDPANAPHRDQIELDLHRSFPEHPFFQQEAGIRQLRRCLLAYSKFNPTVGYCQSMNIVASALLLFCDDEEAFFLLSAIIERVPEYYISQMLGSIVDLKIFNGLVAKLKPQLFDHLVRVCGVDIALVSLPWFLCFFVGYLPWEVCFRIFDVFMIEGPCILFQAGLALLTCAEEELKKCRDQVEFTETLKNIVLSPAKLWDFACCSEFRLDSEELAQLRNYHRFQQVLHLESNARELDIGFLLEKTGFPREVLEKIHADFRTALYSSDLNCVGLEEFKALFKLHGPRLNYSSSPGLEGELIQKLFALSKPDVSGFVSFRQYVLTLDILYNGPNASRLKMCFDLYTNTGAAGILQSYFDPCLRTAMALHLQFSEKTRKSVIRTELGALLERWRRKQLGQQEGDEQSQSENTVAAVDNDGLASEWKYMDLDDSLNQLLPSGLSNLWDRPGNASMPFDAFKQIFSNQVGPLQQKFSEIADITAAQD